MKRKHNKIKIFIILLAVVIVVCFFYVVLNNKMMQSNKDNKTNEQKEEKKQEKEKDKEEVIVPPPPKLKIIDLDSKTRPIGVMVDNEKGAWPQAGLQEAFLIYEIIVEGGETRFFALYKDSDVAMIGPVRSARHYYLDYTIENDAIFAHYGFSPQAQNDISNLRVNNISGTQGDNSAFWREKVITTNWQNCFTSTNNLKAKAVSKKYRMTSDATPLLNYSIDEIDISLNQESKIANLIRVNYSSHHYVSYEYDQTSKTYKRYMRGKPHVDRLQEYNIHLRISSFIM